MSHTMFIALLAAGFAAFYAWAFRTLPAARWQFLAAVPLDRTEDGSWRGLNLTFYGVFYALGIALACALGFVLVKSIGVSTLPLAAILVGTVAICMPAARHIAWLIEGRRGTQSVAAGFFTGVLIVPPVLLIAPLLFPSLSLPAIPVFAAFAAAYALGEGVGRLSCVSFGCCYGRRVDSMSGVLRKLLAPIAVRFHGPTKKIAYASGWEDVPVVPIQAITATFFTAVALLGAWLFLEQYYGASLLISIAATQLWRVGSEFLRADFRGARKFTAYQWMSILAVLIVAGWVLLMPTPGNGSPAPDLRAGLSALWTPHGVIGVQLLFAAAFLYAGRSTVTGSRMSFHVAPEHLGAHHAAPSTDTPEEPVALPEPIG